jgi:hypothetical protein
MDLGKYAEHSKQPWTVLFPANPKKSPRGEIVPFGASVDDGKGRVPECVLFLEALGLQIRPGHSNARRTSESRQVRAPRKTSLGSDVPYSRSLESPKSDITRMHSSSINGPL